MKIVYRITEQDYLEAAKLFFANQKPPRRVFRKVMPWVGGLLLFEAGVYLLAFPSHNWAIVALFLLLGVYLLYCGYFAIRRFVRRAYRSNPHFKDDSTADISDSGVHIVTATRDSLSKWGSFVRFLESDRIFVLFYSEFIFIIFPKRAFAPGEVEQLRELLTLNVASAK